MRILMVFCALAGFAGQALAQDLDRPILRGSNVHELAAPTNYRWSGLYGGGHFGFSGANVNISAGTSDLVDYLVRNSVLEGVISSWTTLNNGSTTASSWGGFAGYNTQWDRAVLGAEINFNHTALSHSSSDTMTRLLQNDAQAPAGHH